MSVAQLVSFYMDKEAGTLDPTGKLKEGQIHFKSSQYLKDPLENFNPNILTGDVLVRRFKLP